MLSRALEANHDHVTCGERWIPILFILVPCLTYTGSSTVVRSGDGKSPGLEHDRGGIFGDRRE